MRTIEKLSPESARLLFISGPRKTVLVQGESERDVLRRQFHEQLNKLEFFTVENAVRRQRLAAEIEAISSKENAVEIIPYDENIDDLPEVFDLKPISVRRVKGKIRTVEPARFYFVPEPDESLIPDDTDEQGEAA